MSPLKRSNNFAARMGRWSATHRKTAIFGWLAFVVASVVIGGAVGTKTLSANDTLPGESGRMMRILDDGFKQPASESVLIESEKLTVSSPAFRSAVEDVVATLSKSKDVTNIRSPLLEANRGQITPDERAALVTFDVRGDVDEAENKIEPIVASVTEVQKRHPALFIGEVGTASANKELDEKFASQLERAGMLSLPVTLVILVLAFGALVAAGIPLLLGLTAVIATMGLVAIPSQLMAVDENVSAIVLLIGLAVGVDYTMFYLKREREERTAGRSSDAAVEAAAATSGRAILISGLTVMAAMAGMFLTGDKTFMSFAVATIIVVAVAVLGSLTVLPALLSKLGDNVERLRVPFIHRLRRDDGSGGAWSWILGRVLRRPLVSVLVAGGALVALALPALTLNPVAPGIEAMPQDLPTMQVFNRLQETFPGEQTPAQVVVEGENLRSPEFREAVGQLEWRALSTNLMNEPITVDVNQAGTVAKIEIPTTGQGAEETAYAAVDKLRTELVPDTVGALPGVETGVTGDSAVSKDWKGAMESSAPWVFAFVLLLAFILLLVSFRSIVIAIKAIVLNLLSVAAAFGLLVLVFQHDWAKGILGFDYSGGIMAFLPVFLFVILFGLSMDYHVFILSRVRELYDRGLTTEDAVAEGIKSTAGVVTSAAMVMVFVFSIFATLSIVMFKQFGIGLAAAVLIDATIVRAVLLPATMKLLGDWNWYLPRWLEWLPHLEHGGAAEKAPESAPVLVP